MVSFGGGHSGSWLELMRAYQQYREAVFGWLKEDEAVRRGDLLAELTSLFGSGRDLQRRLLVTDFLRGAEMWDEGTIALVWRELTQAAWAEQEEVAAWAGEALLKIRDLPGRCRIADEVFVLAERELRKAEPDYVAFGMGCTLLMRLGMAEYFEKFCAQYGEQIYLGNGLDEADLEEMLARIEADGG